MQGLKIKIDTTNLEEVNEKLKQAVMLANELKELIDSNKELKKLLDDDYEAFVNGKITINEMRKKHGLEPILGVHAADEKLTFARKQIKDMTENKIIRQQLEILAEGSLNAEPETLVKLSLAMAELLRIECY